MRMTGNFDTMCMTEIEVVLVDGGSRVDEGAVHVEQDSLDINFVARHGERYLWLVGKGAEMQKAGSSSKVKHIELARDSGIFTVDPGLFGQYYVLSYHIS